MTRLKKGSGPQEITSLSCTARDSLDPTLEAPAAGALTCIEFADHAPKLPIVACAAALTACGIVGDSERIESTDSMAPAEETIVHNKPSTCKLATKVCSIVSLILVLRMWDYHLGKAGSTVESRRWLSPEVVCPRGSRTLAWCASMVAGSIEQAP